MSSKSPSRDELDRRDVAHALALLLAAVALALLV